MIRDTSLSTYDELRGSGRLGTNSRPGRAYGNAIVAEAAGAVITAYMQTKDV